MTRLLWLAIVVMHLISCAPHVNQVSVRNPDLFEKESDRLQGHSRGAESTSGPDLFVRDRRPVIRESNRPNETGSLYNPDDERNYLFSPTGPQNVGRFLSVKVVSGRSAPKAGDEPADSKPEDGKDQEESELLKALPHLEPEKEGDIVLQKSFKMRIVHRFDNGDVLARLDRQSQSSEGERVVLAEARIPYDRIAAGDGLTTDDLQDVKFVQSGADDLIERTSSGWEDEYSLRLSGFDEAKSKLAMSLEDQKKQIEEVKTKLEDKIKALGDQRRQLVKEREEMMKRSAEAQDNVKEAEKTIAEQKDVMAAQKGEIANLKPENKPGDDKESAE